VLERSLIRAAAPLVALLLFTAPAALLHGAEEGPAAAGAADIELRKSFRPSRRDSRQATPRQTPEAERGEPTAPVVSGDAPPRLGAVAEALDEQLQSSGTLHLPGVRGGIVLKISETPILETGSGRHLIIDRERTIDAGVADEISLRWPGFSVVQPAAGADLHEVLGSVLDAAGYDSVLRSAPLVFGRDVTLRITPDYTVLRNESDLLKGETRAISVVKPSESLPVELRELADQHRVRIVELTPDGALAGADQAPARARPGQVTTIEAAQLAPIIEKIASAIGLSVVQGVLLPDAVGERGLRSDLGVGGDGIAALVFEKVDPLFLESLVGRGYMAIWLNSAADLTEAIGALLKRFGIPALGPSVEFFRAPTPGSTRRFVINVPGWLAQSGGRRLLITGTTPPPLVRRYLTREGIDIIEYRIRQ
jgi:hypothetical protein